MHCIGQNAPADPVSPALCGVWPHGTAGVTPADPWAPHNPPAFWLPSHAVCPALQGRFCLVWRTCCSHACKELLAWTTCVTWGRDQAPPVKWTPPVTQGNSQFWAVFSACSFQLDRVVCEALQELPSPDPGKSQHSLIRAFSSWPQTHQHHQPVLQHAMLGHSTVPVPWRCPGSYWCWFGAYW